MNRLTWEAGGIFLSVLIKLYSHRQACALTHMCTHKHTHTAREMLCYTTQRFSDKRRQVNATGSHVVNTDISLLYVWVCVCDITHLRIYKNVFKMINMRCLRSLCGWTPWTWLQPCCTHIYTGNTRNTDI